MTTVALTATQLAQLHEVCLERMLDALARAERDGLVQQDERGKWTATARGRSLTRELLLDIEHVNTLDRESS